MQSLHLLFFLPFLFVFFFFFFSAVVPESMILSLTFSLLMLMDRGLRSFPCSHFFGVAIELLLIVDVFMLEETRKILVPRRLAKLKKGGEGKRGGETCAHFLAISRCQPWCSHPLAVLSSWCKCVFHLSRLCYPKQACHNQEPELFLQAGKC